MGLMVLVQLGIVLTLFLVLVMLIVGHIYLLVDIMELYVGIRRVVVLFMVVPNILNSLRMPVR